MKNTFYKRAFVGRIVSFELPVARTDRKLINFKSYTLLTGSGVPRNFVRGGEFQQIQLRTEDRENGDVGVVAP